jgi:acyl-homoserine lactone acylase PvdQ
MVLRGPGIAVRGPTIPGAGFPIAGRGGDFAWSVTTAQGDNTDVFAERLCNPGDSKPTLASTHYVRGSKCVAFTVQERPLDWAPGPSDALTGGRTDPYHATIRVARSVHGPVIAHGTVGGRPVAFARSRASYMREIPAAVGLDQLASGPVRGPRDFQRKIAQVSGSYNWFYADAEHIAYVQSGLYPRRARGSHPELPTWGTGRFDWRGMLPYRRLPQSIDPRRGYLVSWNQKQAPGWRASDADWQYGSVHRSQRLETRVRRAQRAGRIGLGQLAAIMGSAGTVDVRGEQVLPWMLRVIGRNPPADVAPAAEVLRRWADTGAHRRDADGNGAYDDSAAVALMDAWWGPAVDAIYKPVLGDELFDAIAHVNQVDYLPKDGPDTYYYGWYSYVQKDLRTLLDRRVRGRLSRGYCGRGSLRRCRATLRTTLAAAAKRVGDLGAVRVAPTCPETVPQTCDQLQFTAAGAITVPPVPWQDRGSWQQVVQVTG